jgi:hypothetical protein
MSDPNSEREGLVTSFMNCAVGCRASFFRSSFVLYSGVWKSS